jgi:catechol 2,3-dioxygenase-like lactoylglutathione lyase family enzyme
LVSATPGLVQNRLGEPVLERSALIGLVAVSDVARAWRLYAGTLGLPIVEESPFALVADAGGTMLGLTVVERPVAARYTVLGWDGAGIAPMMDWLSAPGVQFTRYQGMGQDDRGVWTAAGGAKIAWFLDPDGNNLSLTQFETSD